MKKKTQKVGTTRKGIRKINGVRRPVFITKVSRSKVKVRVQKPRNKKGKRRRR